MKVLCVYPPFDPSYWGMEYSRHMVAKAGQLPPLGLLTVAALLPREWEVRLCDMQVEPLRDADLEWADVVFLSGMLIQREALLGVARRARAVGTIVVCGGPYASALPDEVEPEVDCVVVGEAEELMAPLCAALAAGRHALPRRLTAPRRPDVARSPLPRFDLLGSRRYHSMGVQWSR
ncbi:MAG: cobalamin B12-binding domain-containing protein, partial [Deltaproteobacteria bacterium]|nr:cobalamin B12-binding domain-containing protein [Deltaproteobacteria bacterium]